MSEDSQKRQEDFEKKVLFAHRLIVDTLNEADIDNLAATNALVSLAAQTAVVVDISMGKFIQVCAEAYTFHRLRIKERGGGKNGYRRN